MNLTLFSFSAFLLFWKTIFSFSNYFPPFPPPNISLLYSPCHKSKCHEVQSPMPPFYLADLCSPRIWSCYFLRWEGHISTFSGGRVTFFLSKVGKWPLYFPRWEGYLFMRRLETLPLTFAFVSTNITVRWTSLKMRLNNKIFIHN